MLNRFVFVTLTSLLLACGLSSQKVMIKGQEMLYGETSREQIFFDYPEWEKGYQSFHPDEAITAGLSGKGDGVRVEIFYGTWCGDSRREVPHFFKIADAANLQFDNVTLWAVDRSKKVDGDRADRMNIRRVATFIFFRGNEEIGRIIERPKASLEADMLQILK